MHWPSVSVTSRNAPFLHLYFSLARRFFLPTSFLTAVKSFHTGFVTSIFRLPRRPEERRAGVGFLTLNFPPVLSLAVAAPGPAPNDLNADWMPMSFFFFVKAKGGSWS